VVNISQNRRQFLGTLAAVALGAATKTTQSGCRFDKAGLAPPDAGDAGPSDGGDAGDGGIEYVVENDDVTARINADVLYRGRVDSDDYESATFVAFESDGVTPKNNVPAEQDGDDLTGTLQNGYSGPGFYLCTLMINAGQPSQASADAQTKILPEYVDDIAENWGAFVGLSQDVTNERTNLETFQAAVQNAPNYSQFIDEATRNKVADYFDNLGNKDVTDMRIIVGPGNNGFLAMKIGNANYSGMNDVYEALEIGNTDAQNMINILTTPQ